jgi:NAD(P)-dependent dehydrogenase (short-subunit alcohol dehydrogenase family)
MNQARIAVVTGANSGLGKVTARELAGAGFKTILACRSRQRGETAAEEIMDEVPAAELQVVQVDLSDLEQVRRVAQEIKELAPHLDVLINNAGYLPAERVLVAPGIEQSFCANHLGPFLLTDLLLDSLKAAPAGRIVNVSSEFHRLARIPFDDLAFERRYGSYYAYNVAKLANLMATHELARRLQTENRSKLTVNACHPGFIRSGFGDDTHWFLRLGIKATRPFLMSAERGARTQIYLATSPEVATISGKYFKSRRIAKPSRYSRDATACKRLWDVSAELTGLD